MVKVFIESYGCSSNIADSEIMSGLLKQSGFEIVSSINNSDLNIICTCNVKAPTSQRMIYRIKELTKIKKPLIVAGCMPKTERNAIEKINPRASLVGPDSIQKIVDVAGATLKNQKLVVLEDLRKPKVCLPRVRKNSIIDIIPIAIGCLSNCSYCEVKFARGKLFSYPIEMIVEEAKQAVNNGCKELWITSQDNSCYGRDIDTDLPRLLNKICEIEGKFFIRVGMMNPLHTKQILEELIRVYQNEKIFKFLHLPVQSGSNHILQLMKRGYKVKDFVDIVERFRKKIKELTLSTDVIVGFPSETEEDFNSTVDLIKKMKPHIVNISKFGARPETEAVKMKQLDINTVSKRSRILHELLREIGFENNKKWIGWEGEVLIDEKVKGAVVGRNFAYKPIVIKGGSVGEFMNIRIIEVTPLNLFGEILNT